MKTKPKPNSRHAQPTLDVLAPRMDKKLNKIAKHMLTLANHTNRLTDEKIILHGQVETLTEAYNRAEVRWKTKYDALLAENASLRETQCKCPPTVANVFVAAPLSGGWEKPNEPMASVAQTDITAPAPPASFLRENEEAIVFGPPGLGGPISGEFPTLDFQFSVAPVHVYSKGGRCERCNRLRIAIEASDLPCVAVGENHGT